jgi:hypothetical protein
MNSPSAEILLVTPVWKDSSRLSVFGKELAVALAESSLPIRWVIADDGSGIEEKSRLAELHQGFLKLFPKVQLYFAQKHMGKGSVVREAWALDPHAGWLAFVDADGSVSANDMLGLIQDAVSSGTSVLGVRRRTATTKIVESPWRALAHRGFLTIARRVLDLDCDDPQCGGKVLKGEEYRRVVTQLYENGLAFDSELLSALKNDGATWKEVPVNWEEKPGGKVKPLRDAWAMLAALFRIHRRMKGAGKSEG